VYHLPLFYTTARQQPTMSVVTLCHKCLDAHGVSLYCLLQLSEVSTLLTLCIMDLLLFSEHIVVISLKHNESLSFIMVR